MKRVNDIKQTMTGPGVQIAGNITGRNQITINNGSEILSILVKRYEAIVTEQEKEIQRLKEILSKHSRAGPQNK
jgi:hypothetical protein